MCTNERERKVFARAQTRRETRLRLGAAHKYAAACTTRKMTGQDVFELDSTRANILRGQTLAAMDRIVSSCSLAALARQRIFILVPLRNPSNVKTVPHEAILPSGLGLPRVHLV